jgi:hypothetical protein
VLVQLARHAVGAAFLPADDKRPLLAAIDRAASERML